MEKCCRKETEQVLHGIIKPPSAHMISNWCPKAFPKQYYNDENSPGTWRSVRTVHFISNSYIPSSVFSSQSSWIMQSRINAHANSCFLSLSHCLSFSLHLALFRIQNFVTHTKSTIHKYTPSSLPCNRLGLKASGWNATLIWYTYRRSALIKRADTV